MRVLLAGGGTGGHLMPAINIARTLGRIQPETQFLFVGARGGMEKAIVERNGFEIAEIDVVGLRRNLRGLYDFSRRIAGGLREARLIVRKFAPDVVVGTGGFVSAPVVVAAKRQHVRTLIQEQNVCPGLATRFLARFADRVCLAFAGSAKFFSGNKNIIITGNPLRSDLLAPANNGVLAEFGLVPQKKVLFVTGGSRGAKSINEAILAFLRKRLLPDGWQILWQTGADHYDALAAQVKDAGVLGRLTPFIDSMPKAYAVADLLVCRAGAMTLSELLVLGLPALLVPYPHATADHQMKNALDLKAQGAVEVIADAKLKSAEFVTLLTRLLEDESRRESLRQKARLLGNPGGADLIAEEIIKLR